MQESTGPALYLLDIDHADPRVERFVPADPESPLLGERGWDIADRLTDFYPARPAAAAWEPPRLADVWTPLPVIGRMRPWNDFPMLMDVPAFSGRAVRALRDVLEANGELLPLVYDTGEYWAYNLRRVADVVDVDRSTSAIDDPEARIRHFPFTELTHYVLHPGRMAGLSIFRLPHDPIGTYATQTFVDRVRAAGLRNFVFRKVAPYPEGTMWSTEQRREAKRLKARDDAATPASYRRHSVVIRLMVGAARKPNRQEREHVAAIMDSLDRLLVDRHAAYEDAPFGSLEGDELVKGEHRLFLSCPDADRLFEHLRTWLRFLDWPGAVRVAKRYGELRDEGAPEVACDGSW